METVVKKAHQQNEADGDHRKLYEAMFLIDSALVSDWDGDPTSQEKGEADAQPSGGQAVITTIETILEKAGAQIVSMKKWDERKLAYEINHKTRGTYILVYFRADGERIRDIERDVQLSEQIMRVLILVCSDDLPSPAEAEEAAKVEETAKTESAESDPLKTGRDEQQAVEDTEKQPEPVPSEAEGKEASESAN